MDNLSSLLLAAQSSAVTAGVWAVSNWETVVAVLAAFASLVRLHYRVGEALTEISSLGKRVDHLVARLFGSLTEEGLLPAIRQEIHDLTRASKDSEEAHDELRRLYQGLEKSYSDIRLTCAQNHVEG